MIFVRKFLLVLVFLLFFFCFLSRFYPLFIFSVDLNNKLDLIDILLSYIWSFTWILISAYLIVFSVAGNNPYSKLKISLYNKYDSIVFVYLLLYILLIIYSLIYLDFIWSFFMSVLFYWAIISTLLIFYIIFKQIELLDDVNIVQSSLNIFSKKNILSYNLVSVKDNKVWINSWLDNNWSIDPLWWFNEVLQFNLKDRILMKKYLLLFSKRITNLTNNSIFKVSDTVQIKILTHALHYLIRLNRRLKKELWYDVFRKIFLNVLLDLIYSILKSKYSEINKIKLEILFYWFTKINLEYFDINFYWNWDPVIDFIKIKSILDLKWYNALNDKIDWIILLLDKETLYISKSLNKEVLKFIPESISEKQHLTFNQIFESKFNIW